MAAAASAFADERAALLEAIHHLENPHDVTRPGRFGELGAYQFRPTTWQMHTSIPFRRALDRDTSDSVAVIHYEWLKRSLQASRVPATSYNIALAWNGGLDAAVRGRAPLAAHKYAQRAVNLASSFMPMTVPAASAPATPAAPAAGLTPAPVLFMTTPRPPQLFADAR